MAELIKKTINEFSFSFLLSDAGTVVYDTVPAAFAEEWMNCFDKAFALIIGNPNPFPESVKAFAERFPDAKIYASDYVGYMLESLLGSDTVITHVREKMKIRLGEETVDISVKSNAGKGSSLSAEFGGESFDQAKRALPLDAEETSVAVIYVSGCDYNETVAREMARGVSDVGNLPVKLVDLASTGIEEAAAVIAESCGVIIGTPSDDDAHRKVWKLLTELPGKLFAGKEFRIFGTFRRNDRGMKNIAERLRQLDANLKDNGLSVQYVPSKASFESIYEYGYAFACDLTGTLNTHSSRLVKCIVCGLVFDSALGECPLCKAGLDKCIPVEGEEIGYAADTDRNYVIIGGGAAGVSAAEAIRNRDKTGSIVIVSSENELPFNRPRLSKGMAVVNHDLESILMHDAEWYKDKNIQILPGSSVESIDAEAKCVTVSGLYNCTLLYDKLIYAAGAECNVIPIPGHDLKGVMTVRHFSDVKQIVSLRGVAENAVVIGGGVLGLEIASELKKMYLNTTVVEVADRLMPRQLDALTAERLLEDCRKFGVNILTGVNTKCIKGDENGNVCGVELEDSRLIAADLVIFSCGNKGNVQVASGCGIKLGRSVIVDNHMRTSEKDIFACGDCAEINGMNYQLWTEATSQGRVAGANAVGDAVVYDEIPYGTSFDAMKVRFFAMGDVGTGDAEYKTVSLENRVENIFKKFWFLDGRLTGGILYGDVTDSLTLSDGVISAARYEDIIDLLG